MSTSASPGGHATYNPCPFCQAYVHVSELRRVDREIRRGHRFVPLEAWVCEACHSEDMRQLEARALLRPEPVRVKSGSILTGVTY